MEVINWVPLIMASPSLASNLIGVRLWLSKTYWASPQPVEGLQARPSPIMPRAKWDKGARSPLAPTVPCSGTQGKHEAIENKIHNGIAGSKYSAKISISKLFSHNLKWHILRYCCRSWFLVCNLTLTQLGRRPPKKMEDNLKKNGKWPPKKWKWKTNSIVRQSYWADLTTKTSKTNGFDTIEIDLVLFH